MNRKTPAAPLPLRDGFDVLDAFHKEMLAHLKELAALVEHLRAGSADGRALAALTALMAFFSGPAREHNAQEDRHVFPPLLAGADPDLVRMAERLTEDHAWIEVYWADVAKQLEPLLNGSSSVDLVPLREAAANFVSLYQEHIALEELLLYPQARSRLDAVERRALSRALSAQRVVSR